MAQAQDVSTSEQSGKQRMKEGEKVARLTVPAEQPARLPLLLAHLEDHADVAAVWAHVVKRVQQAHAALGVGGVVLAYLNQGAEEVGGLGLLCVFELLLPRKARCDSSASASIASACNQHSS